MTDAMASLASALADRYTVERELGAGGMAVVYLARDLKHERKVAVKVLRPELAAAIGADRFLREIRIAANLNHPHILPLHDSGEADGYLYYVMPYAKGESLRDRMDREKQLPLADAVNIASEVADALGSAHRNNVIHRDIKPENILLEEGHAVVADFGVARAIEEAEETKLTETGIAIGTPAYLSPEQATGERELDGRSDIYALGCVLYEMLAGQPPFSGPTVESVVRQHLAADPQSVTAVRPTVPVEVEAAVSKALAKAPADRHQCAEDLAAALSAAASVVQGAPQPGIASRWSHPVAVAGLLGVGAVAVLGVVYLLMIQLGLPDWVFVAAATLLAVILPLTLGTALVERHRTTSRVPTPTGGIGSLAHRWLRWRKAAQGSLIVFAGLGVVTTGYMTMRTLGIGPLGTVTAKGILEERDPILLADFENRTSDSTMARTVTEALRIDLSQSQVVRLVHPTVVTGVLERMQLDPGIAVDQALASEMAVREGIKAVVTGEIGQLGDGYVVSATLVAPSDGLVLTAVRTEADHEGELIEALNQLSHNLRERIGESLKAVRASPPLQRVTTASLDALRLYSRAYAADNEGDQERTVVLLREAVRLDTTFAMAYRKLAVEAPSPSEKTAAARKAFELSDRLTPVERFHATAIYYGIVEGDVSQRMAAYRSLLELNPDDPTALNNLGVSLYRTRRYAEAESLLLRAQDVDHSTSSFVVGAWVQICQSRYDAAAATLDRFAERYPGNPSYFRQRALNLAGTQFDYETAGAYLDSLEQAQQDDLGWQSQVKLGRGRIALIRGQLAAAERHMREYLRLVEQRGLVGTYLRSVALDLARTYIAYKNAHAQAWRLIEEALRRYPLDSLPAAERPYTNLAKAAVMAGRTDLAGEWLSERITLGDSGLLPMLQPHEEAEVRGAVAFAEQRPADAIAAYHVFHEGTDCHNCAFPHLAKAYDVLGRPDSALAYYERYLATPYDGRWLLDGFELPAAYKRLGELYEQRGDHDNAIRYYNEFVALWIDADPELQPQVEDVRGRIARLAGEPRRTSGTIR